MTVVRRDPATPAAPPARPSTASTTTTPVATSSIATTATTATTTTTATSTTRASRPAPSTGSVFEARPATSAAMLRPAPAATASSGRAVLDVRLGNAAPVRPFGGAAFEAALDACTASRARSCNDVRVLFDGVNSFAERNRMIDAATSSIHLQTFIFSDDDTGRELAQRLAAKAREGVAVRVIVDGIGSNSTPEKLFAMMRAAGVEVRAHETGMNLLAVNNRWHEKHLIVDGRVAVTGGMNIADEYALGGSGRLVMSRGETGAEAWRDVDVRIEGLAVHDEQRAFLRNWNKLGARAETPGTGTLYATPTTRPGGVDVRVVQQHSAGDPPEDHLLQLYVQSVRAATRSVTIENAYFVPPKELREALIDAAARGVRVRVMTNSKESSDLGFVVDGARYFYDELLAAGVEIHEKRGGTLHAKTACFDGQYAIVGSYNLNGRSAGLDAECAVAIRDDKTAALLETRFDNGVAAAQPVGLHDVAQDSFVDDVKQWMMSTLSWTI